MRYFPFGIADWAGTITAAAGKCRAGAWRFLRRHPVAVWVTLGIIASGAAVVLVSIGLVVMHVHGDRTNLPDSGPFERFEFLAIGPRV